MSKPKLVVPIEYSQSVSWNNTLTRMLIESNVFDISYEKTSSKKNPTDQYWRYPNFPGSRNNNFTSLKVNDCLIGLDTWDTLSPVWHFEQAGFFKKPDGLLSNYNLIIKIQHYKCQYWNEFEKRTGIRSSAWTVMPTYIWPYNPAPMNWENKNHKYVTSLTGRNNRFGRQPWVDFAAKQKDFYTKTDYVSTDSFDDYINILKECKWGMILKGRRGAEKNRRESEFSSCGIPLVLNYIPEYPFEMIPNKHFVYIEKPEDMAKLRDIDPKPYSEASRFLWNNYFSPVGMAKTLIKLSSI
jgi:hypothetical protein